MIAERKKKVCFSKEEDEMIISYVEKYGATSWKKIEEVIPTRTRRQCRERWTNFLSPNISQKKWTLEEDLLLQNFVEQYGQKWSDFVSSFPGRTNILIRNRYHLIIRHKQKRKKIKYQEKEEPKSKESKEEIFPNLSFFDDFYFQDDFF
jgi:hypothetical protein